MIYLYHPLFVWIILFLTIKMILSSINPTISYQNASETIMHLNIMGSNLNLIPKKIKSIEVKQRLCFSSFFLEAQPFIKYCVSFGQKG